MPELPDVETMRRYVLATALHQRVQRVIVHDMKVLSGVSTKRLKRTVEGREFESARRHGKYLPVELDRGGWLVLHFGMTGSLKYYKRDSHEPRYSRVMFAMKNGYHLAYLNSRRLGRISLADNLDTFIGDHALGPDCFSEEFDFAAFNDRLDRGRGKVKTTLMNQSIMAGIGNIYSDEILFQAGINPETEVKNLGRQARRRLFRSMKYVLEKTVEAKADPDHFPRSYLTRRREEGAKCPRCGGSVQRKTISGRSSYFCARHQKG